MAILSVVKMKKRSGVPTDAIENTFSFDIEPGALNVNVLGINAALLDFYTTVGPIGHAVVDYLAPSLSGDATILHYVIDGHLNGSGHGAPVAMTDVTIAGIDSTKVPLPDEVACCLSFQSDYATDIEFGVGSRPRARDRGRVYIGPLNNVGAATDATTKEAAPSLVLRGTIAEAAERLMGADVAWSVWSRRKAALAPVISGWVDDAWDTQRRRGNKATTRTTFPV